MIDLEPAEAELIARLHSLRDARPAVDGDEQLEVRVAQGLTVAAWQRDVDALRGALGVLLVERALSEESERRFGPGPKW